MIGSTGAFDAVSLVGKIMGEAFRNSYENAMKGVYSAELTVIPFVFGKLDESKKVYRKFFYNSDGKVEKKLSFDWDGNIEMRDTYEFNSDGKHLRGHFITENSVSQEEYTYITDKKKKRSRLVKYVFTNEKWAHGKKEEYEYDEHDRKVKKTSYGLMNTPEMITHYLYDDASSRRYRFRHVTQPNGDLITTFLFTNDPAGNLAAVYSFSLPPDKLKKSMKTKGWELKSDTRSRWTYDQKGNPITFVKDKKVDKLKLLFASADANTDFGAPQEGRIIIQKSSSVYKEFKGRNYLVETVEWLPKFNEALKEVKKYTYYDVKNNVVKLT